MQVVIVENEPLAKYTSWRIGGPARYFANVTAPDRLRAALDWARERDVPVSILGGGTNTLVRDEGFPGLVLRYRSQELQIASAETEARARIGAGAPMAGTARRLAGQGWVGLEWAEGLPGTIGGAVFGNAGCYGGDVAAVLTRAWLLADDEIVEWPVERFAYGYRTSALKAVSTTNHPLGTGEWGLGTRDWSGGGDNPQSPIPNPQSLDRPSSFVLRPSSLVVAAEFKLTRADPRALAEQMRQIAAERKSKTPIGSSCGSVFKNPPHDSAGRLIEAAGLKGASAGAAEISRKHANYIVNHGGASSADILRLIDMARERVLKECGVELELEVQVVG